MPPSKRGKGKKTAALPSGARSAIKKDDSSSMFSAKKKNFGIGNLQPRRDLSRFVKWPRYIRLQRQRRILNMRLKVPPAIAQFGKTLDVHGAKNVFGLLNKYRPEEKKAKKERLQAQAAGSASATKPYFVKSGLNHITNLVEGKKAQLVVIAHDVEPVETIVWLPALCRAMDIPYCIVKGKARLGEVVHMKTATCLAITEVKAEHKHELTKIAEMCKSNFNEKGQELGRSWGGGIMGVKNLARMSKLRAARAKEAAKKAGM